MVHIHRNSRNQILFTTTGFDDSDDLELHFAAGSSPLVDYVLFPTSCSFIPPVLKWLSERENVKLRNLTSHIHMRLTADDAVMFKLLFSDHEL